MNDNNDLPAVKTKTFLSVKDAMTEDTQAAIDEMQAGLYVARTVIETLGKMVEGMQQEPEKLKDINPVKLKQIIETNFTALATIRKLRYMDIDDATENRAEGIDSMLKRIHSKALLNSVQPAQPIGRPGSDIAMQQTTTTTKTRVIVGEAAPRVVGHTIQAENQGKPGKRRK